MALALALALAVAVAALAWAAIGWQRARAALRAASSAGAHLLTETMPVGVLRMDAAGVCTDVSERFRELWHMDPDQPLAGFDWYSGLHADDRDQILSDWSAAMAA